MLIRPLTLYAPDDGGGSDAAQAPAPTADTPENPANTPVEQSEGTGGHVETPDYESRFKEAQAWGTKASQEAAELREQVQVLNAWNSDDPAAQAWAAEQLGIQLEDEEGDGSDTQDSNYAQLDPELQRQIGQLTEYQQQQIMVQQQQQQSQQEAELHQAVLGEAKSVLAPMGVTDESVLEAVAGLAANPDLLPWVHTPQGLMPDINGALEQIAQAAMLGANLPQVKKKLLEGYQSTKQAPHFSSDGTAGTQVPDLSDRNARQAHMIETAKRLDTGQ